MRPSISSPCTLPVRLGVVLALGASVLALPVAAGEAVGLEAEPPVEAASTTSTPTMLGPLDLPLPLTERRQMRRRMVGPWFTIRETVEWDVPEGQALTLQVDLIFFEGERFKDLAENFERAVLHPLLHSGPAEVSEVRVGGYPLRLLRASGEGASRKFILAGVLESVGMQATLVLPASLADHEEAFVAALMDLQPSLPDMLRERDDVVAVGAGIDAGARVIMQFGDFPTHGELDVRLEMDVQSFEGDPSIRASSQLFRVSVPGDPQSPSAGFVLTCNSFTSSTSGTLVDDVVRILVPLSRGEPVGPVPSWIGPIAARRWSGLKEGEDDVLIVIRFVESHDGFEYVAMIEGTAQSHLVPQIEAWLEDAAAPRCAPIRWRTNG